MLRNMTQSFRTAEGRLIYDAIERSGLSVRAVARDVPISDTRLRQWYRGVEGRGIEVNFPSRQLARVAQLVRVTPDELREAGRGDAADILEQINRDRVLADEVRDMSHEQLVRTVLNLAKRLGEVEEIAEKVDDIVERLDEMDSE